MGKPYLKLEIESARVSTKFQSKDKDKKLRPIFYLPYQKNNTARMKLSQPATHHGDDVKFFATATIDGCSVYVEGDRNSPKVTHSNASAVNPTSLTDTYAQKLPKIAAKTAEMDRRYGFLDKGVGTSRVVERPHYITEDAPGILALKQRFAAAMGLNVASVAKYEPFGAIVGCKDRDGWRFYVQANGLFTYHPANGPAHGKSSYWVISCTEFWPGGGGVARTIR